MHAPVHPCKIRINFPDRRIDVATSAEESVEGVVRSLRIVVGGLMAGLAAFAAIGIAMAPISDPPDPGMSRLLLLGLPVVMVACAGAYFTLRLSMIRDLASRAVELRQSAEPARLIVGRYRQFAVVGAGLIDFPGAVGGLAYLVTGNPIALGALAGAALLLLAHMPSVDHLHRLAERAAMGSEA